MASERRNDAFSRVRVRLFVLIHCLLGEVRGGFPVRVVVVEAGVAHLVLDRAVLEDALAEDELYRPHDA